MMPSRSNGARKAPASRGAGVVGLVALSSVPMRGEATGRGRLGRFVSSAILGGALIVACSPFDVVAPTNSLLTLSANPVTIGLNGSHSVVTATLVKTDGTAVLNGTTIFFATTNGSIPETAETRNGIAKVELVSGDTRGLATVTARSGTLGADDNAVTENSVSIEVQIGRVPAAFALAADPADLPPAGGRSKITVVVFDEQGDPVPDAAVAFATTAGTFTPGDASFQTDAQGKARVRLKTQASATITATVGSLDPQSIPVLVNVDAPVPVIFFSPTDPAVGQTVHFSGAGSTDGGRIVAYEWDFGNGSTARGKKAQAEYSTPGTYVASLEITDDDRNVAATTASVTVVTATAPTATFTFSPGSPVVGQTVRFVGAESTTEIAIVAYEWDFGNGKTAVGRKAQTEYSTAGTYVVSMEVTDSEGNLGAKTESVTVAAGAAPTASFTFSPAAPVAATSVSFDGSASFDPDGQVLEWTWTWGDSTSPTVTTSSATTHTYAVAGTYTVTLTVRDDQGLSSAAVTLSVVVS